MSIKLNYKVFGQGEPVVILHGLFGMLDNWQTFAKKMAENYMVYIVDQRDHGKSPHTNEFSYPILAEDLYEFMNDNWLHKARIIGHSMGGKTAMQFTSCHEDMVEQLVVVDIAPVKYKRGHDTIFDALFAVDISTMKSRKEVESILTNYISDVGIKLFLMKNLNRNKEGGFKWKMNLNLLHKEYLNIIDSVDSSEVNVDTLFVRGELSNYINKEGVEKINEIFPNSKIKTIENSGHWVHAEKPDILMNEILEFFENKYS